MANRVTQLDAEVKAQHANATLKRRGRNFIEHDLGNGVTRWTGTIEPLHTRAGAEIDTAWVSDASPWSYRISSADYITRIKAAFNGAPLLQYTDVVTGAWVTLQPQQLNWTNDSNSVQMISAVQGVTATLADDLVRWAGAYGAGRDFVYINHPKWLIKHLVLQNALPAPSASILSGANPCLQLQFMFNWSGADVYIDGALWDGKTAKTTASRIEFRVNGAPVYWFDAPSAWDANNEYATGVVLRTRKAGNNLYIEVRVPYAWLASAPYPVTVDPTLTLDQGESGIDVDTYLRSAAATSNFGTAEYMRFNDGSTHVGILAISLASIGSGATCNSATLSVYPVVSLGVSDVGLFLYKLAAANENWTEGGATWNTKDGSNAWAGSVGCATSGTDYDATEVGTGTLVGTTNGGAIGDENTITLSTSAVAGEFGGTLHLRLSSSATADRYVGAAENSTAGYRPKLVVDYTAVASGNPYYAYAQM